MYMVFRAIFDKIKQGLARTRSVFSGIASLFRLRGKVDKDFLAELEKRLYLADVGTAPPARSSTASARRSSTRKSPATWRPSSSSSSRRCSRPRGPTSTGTPPGRRSSWWPASTAPARRPPSPSWPSASRTDGKKVMVAACDTFRAAAVEQLTIWSQRIGCEIVKNQQGSDPASVAHDACEQAKARGFDVLIVDTAGRLHTQTHLMRELEKIHRVVSKQIDGAPHEVLLVLDATTGQNAIAQAEKFKKTVQCTGIILSKLDGTAKGGAIFAIKQKLGLPVKFIGVGEKLDDLEPFDPEAYVEALFCLTGRHSHGGAGLSLSKYANRSFSSSGVFTKPAGIGDCDESFLVFNVLFQHGHARGVRLEQFQTVGRFAYHKAGKNAAVGQSESGGAEGVGHLFTRQQDRLHHVGRGEAFARLAQTGRRRLSGRP